MLKNSYELVVDDSGCACSFIDSNMSCADSYKEYFVESLEYFLARKSEPKSNILIPLSIFKTDLGPSQLVIKYLKEIKKIPLKAISCLLSKSYTNVWLSYNKAKKTKLILSKFSDSLSIAQISHDALTTFESIVFHLKKQYNYSQIARILHKDPRTIWTVYQRVQKKLINQSKGKK